MQMARGKRWTDEEKQTLCRLYSERVGIGEMAAAIGRTEQAVQQRIIQLKLGPVADKYWRPEEIEQLQELWGQKTIPQIAKILKRSVHAVKVKSTRLQLGAFKHSSEYLTGNQVATLMGVDIHTVTDYWIPKLALKYKEIAPLGTQKFRYIRHSDLMLWLQHHPAVWDSRKLDKFALGSEPDWLKAKRNSDMQAPVKQLQKWMPTEDKQLISLFKQGMRSHQEIGAILGRSGASVEHRLSRLDVWGSGKYIGDTRQQARKEKRERLDRLMTIKRIHDLLLFRRNQLAFDGYWQKDMCQHWDDIKGCKAEQTDCDSCTCFRRISEQYCRRCGATVFSRTKLPDRLCQRCRQQRKSQYLKKTRALSGGRSEDISNEAI